MGTRRHKKAKPKKQVKELPAYQAPSSSVDRKAKGTRIDKQEASIKRIKGCGDQSGLLTSDNPTELLADIKLIDQATRPGRNPWNVRRKDMIRQRLEDIVAKTTAEVATKDGGVVSIESKADEISIAASRVLVQMDSLDQKDEIEANKKPEVSNPVSVNVNINNADDRRLRLIELANRLGARELVIEATREEQVERIETTPSIPRDKETPKSSFSFTPDKASPKTS